MRAAGNRSVRNWLATNWKWIIPIFVFAQLAFGVWRFVIVPPLVDRLYDRAVAKYKAADYGQAVAALERAYGLNSRVARVNTLLGWSHWRLGHAQQAEFYFDRARRSNPGDAETRLGLAFASLALDNAAQALPLLQELHRQNPDDKDTRMALGEAYVKTGQNIEAARYYRDLLEHEPSDADVRKALLGLWGYPEYAPGLSWTLPEARQRPAQLAVHFRAHGDRLQALSAGGWSDILPVGVNIGPARPGEFPSTSSREFSTYLEWLKQVAEMNANTVRIYTVLPPAFYQALKAFNEDAARPLWLIQEMWIQDDAEDLYAPSTEQAFRQTLTDTIDLIHGQADIPYRRGHHHGIYTADVSPYVLALAVGREVEPSVVLLTNSRHPAETSYKGEYVSVGRGSPAEIWFARMCDLAARYEVEKYNMQHPLTVVNWPPLDPISHPAESTYAEEIQIRKRLGEPVSEQLPAKVNDADVASLDIMKFRAERSFAAGLFALYHVYQHWPDFLLNEHSYALARDEEGPNPYLGYLRELKAAHPGFPLLIGEYGLATSLAAAHLHPLGWGNGGLTEKQQAELLVRFTRNIRDTGCAGAVVFAWQDEWFKHVHDLFTADFEQPWDRKPLWLNVLDPEQNFGIVGYEPSLTVPVLRGEPDDWKDAQQLYSPESSPSSGAGVGELRALSVKHDFAYLYLRLDVAGGTPDWSARSYWIALNTLPGQSGTRLLPETFLRVETGANFLIQLTGPTSGRILVCRSYNPTEALAMPGPGGRPRLGRKRGMALELAESADFEEMVTEANPPRYARDGRIFPALAFNRSPLPFGTADRSSPEFLSHALWNVTADHGMIELRIPWGLLLMMDPSSLKAFGGTNQQSEPLPLTTEGISVAAFALRASGTPGGTKVVTSSLPALAEGKLTGAPRVYNWRGWNQVEYRPYFKASYLALEKVFEELSPSANDPANPPAAVKPAR